jgi:thimet oligopeptidase
VKIETISDVVHLFPKSTQEINDRAQKVMKKVKNEIDAITALPDDKRTFENTCHALDRAGEELSQEGSVFHTLVMASPHEEMRNEAQKATITLQDFSVDIISQNKELYHAFKRYVDLKAPKENLNQEERYYIEETLKSFKRNGLDLPDKDQEEITKLKKELGVLSTNFSKNINDDDRKVTVTQDELNGLTPDFVRKLKKTDEGRFELGTDYPTYHEVMENCSVESTRKALWTAFNNRAYPANEKVLNDIIALRDDLAHKLGFASYAQYDIDDEMAQNPQTVEAFLNDIAARSTVKAQQEVERYKKHLPDGITLLPDGTIKPWDWAFIKASYRKEKFNLDDRIVAEYFPVASTLEGLLKLYEKFFSIRLKQLPQVAPYGIEIDAVQVSDVDGHLIGYLLLDLYPRPYKYTHACQITLVHGTRNKEGKITPAAGLVLANFPKPSAEKPALLPHTDVVTFFHEFGHAIHGLLGSTEMSGFSGTNVKTDFVEMPSQMLEEWMWDKAVIKNITKHYKTSKPLPDSLLDTMIMLKNLDSGDFNRRQLFYAKTSLEYFKDGRSKDTTAIVRKLQKEARPYIAAMPEDRVQYSFGHLTGYGSKYYSYLWSKVYALDLFDHIKTHGLLDENVGKRYVECILSKGGSRPPQELLREFLGREPNSKAFFKDLGF